MNDSQYLLQKEILELTERKEVLYTKLNIYRNVHNQLLTNGNVDTRDHFILSDVANLVIGLQTEINTLDIKIGNCRSELLHLLSH